MRVLVVMGLLTTGAGCSVLKDDSSDLPDLVVAATLELTGINNEVGQAHQRALNLKAEQINASGVLGDRHLRVVARDNQSNPKTAVTQITDFAADASVTAIVSGACSPCVVEGAKVANAKEVPLISLAATGQVTAAVEQSRYVFKIGPNSTDNSRALANEIVRALKPTDGKKVKLGVLRPTDVYGSESPAAVRIAIGGQGEVLGTGANDPNPKLGEFSPDGSNLPDVARALVAAKPDAVLVWSLPAQAAMAAEALKQAGLAAPVYFDSAAAGSLFLAGTAAEGSTIVFSQTLAMDDVIATTPAKATRKQWFEAYTARFGAYHGQASFAADALDLVVAAVNRAGTNRSAVRGVLESMETDGLSGPLRITPSNHSGLMPQALAVFVARGGRWRLLG